MEILLLLLIIFVFYPLFKMIFTVGKTAHTFKKAYDQQTKQQEKTQQQQAETAEKNGRKERLRKFFRKTSEDVEFEEIKTERNTEKSTIDTDSYISGANEPRVSDARYEDIK